MSLGTLLFAKLDVHGVRSIPLADFTSFCVLLSSLDSGDFALCLLLELIDLKDRSRNIPTLSQALTLALTQALPNPSRCPVDLQDTGLIARDMLMPMMHGGNLEVRGRVRLRREGSLCKPIW